MSQPNLLSPTQVPSPANGKHVPHLQSDHWRLIAEALHLTGRESEVVKAILEGKPDGAVAAWVYSFVGTNYPTDPTEWDFQGATTRSTHEIVFPDSVANGAQVWICAAWINAKQEAGPVSVPITTNVQGGGMAQAA